MRQSAVSLYTFSEFEIEIRRVFSMQGYSIMIFISFELCFCTKKDCTPPFIVEVNFDSVSDLGAGLVNANPSKGEEEKLQTKISGFFKTYFFPQDFAWNTARYMLLLFGALSQQRILAIQAKGTPQTDIDICLHSPVV